MNIDESTNDLIRRVLVKKAGECEIMCLKCNSRAIKFSWSSCESGLCSSFGPGDPFDLMTDWWWLNRVFVLLKSDPEQTSLISDTNQQRQYARNMIMNIKLNAFRLEITMSNSEHSMYSSSYSTFQAQSVMWFTV